MSEIVELVAKTLYEKVALEHDAAMIAWENISPDLRSAFKDDARAVLEVIRKPTREMAHCGGLEWAHGAPETMGSSNQRVEMGTKIWSVMINEALRD